VTYRTKIIALSAAVLLLSIHAVAVTDIRGVIAQGQNRMPLLAEIVNTDEDPVPVSLQGTGDVSGDVNATQAGEWSVDAQQQGDWNVNSAQDGDWNVGIDPDANTVRVDGLSASTRQPFQIAMSPAITEADEDSKFSSTESFMVPEGKLLVIEHVSASASLQSGSVRSASLRTHAIRPFDGLTGGFFPDTPGHELVMEKTGSFGGRDIYRGAQKMLFYAEGGNEVELLFSRDTDSGTAQIFYTLTGYVVDMPE
jgi:hypothetical protein